MRIIIIKKPWITTGKNKKDSGCINEVVLVNVATIFVCREDMRNG